MHPWGRSERTHALPLGKLLRLRVLGVIYSAVGVLFYLTARGTGSARGFLQSDHEGAEFTNVIHKWQ